MKKPSIWHRKLFETPEWVARWAKLAVVCGATLAGIVVLILCISTAPSADIYAQAGKRVGIPGWLMLLEFQLLAAYTFVEVLRVLQTRQLPIGILFSIFAMNGLSDPEKTLRLASEDGDFALQLGFVSATIVLLLLIGFECCKRLWPREFESSIGKRTA